MLRTSLDMFRPTTTWKKIFEFSRHAETRREHEQHFWHWLCMGAARFKFFGLGGEMDFGKRAIQNAMASLEVAVVD